MVDRFFIEEDKEIILTLGTSSRDMITYLGNYTFPEKNLHIVRMVNKNDESNLVPFVEKNFSYEWSQTMREAFSSSNEPKVYIASNKHGEIIGFAAYDVYRDRKGYFGPMGVTVSNRIKGVGYSLLHHCLEDMKDLGYHYAIIGEAGPIEFYEKACNAVVIPSTQF